MINRYKILMGGVAISLLLVGCGSSNSSSDATPQVKVEKDIAKKPTVHTPIDNGLKTSSQNKPDIAKPIPKDKQVDIVK